MAESKSKPAVNGKTTKDKLWSLVCLAKDVGTDFDGVQGLSQLVEETKKLQKQLKAKEVENQQLIAQQKEADRDRKALFIAFEERYKTFDQNSGIIKYQEQEIEHLQADLTANMDKIKNWQEWSKRHEIELKNVDTTRKKYESKLERMETDRLIIESKLKAYEASMKDSALQLSQAQEELGDKGLIDCEETEISHLTNELATLTASCHNVAKKFFSDRDAPEGSNGAILNLKRHFHKLPLSTGSDKEAILMLRAAAEAVVVEALVKHIFRPFYLPDNFRSAAENVLQLFSADDRRQSIYRFQVLNSFDSEEFEMETITAKFSSDVHGFLDQLVPPQELIAFRKNITELLGSAVELWSSSVQISRELVSVEMQAVDDGHLVTCPEYSSMDSAASQNVKRSVVVHLFPRITMGGHILHGGTVLWSDSPAVMIAKEKVASSTTNGSAIQRKGSRRGSTSINPMRPIVGKQ